MACNPQCIGTLGRYDPRTNHPPGFKALLISGYLPGVEFSAKPRCEFDASSFVHIIYTLYIYIHTYSKYTHIVVDIPYLGVDLQTP